MKKLALRLQQSKNKKNQGGFIIADFLFAFVLVIGIGILLFGLTFSLASVEIAQYIVWSSARTYASGNISEVKARQDANIKFKNLIDKFTMFKGDDGSWFKLDGMVVGNLLVSDPDLSSKITGSDDRDNTLKGGKEKRQPWIGASAKLTWKLYSSLRIPFLGTVADGDKDIFSFPIRAFLLRHPSQDECYDFFRQKYSEINRLDSFTNLPGTNLTAVEDNGC